MSAQRTTVAPVTCPSCGAALTRGESCPRCLFGDVLAVLDGPVSPKTPFPSTAPRKQVGEYELLEELGRGGMGVVWKARQRRLNRVVALKLVRGGCLPGEAAAKRFRREAEAAAQLRHPNIVVIHEVGESDEQLYLSMDLVEGGSLADWLKRVAFSPTDAATLVAKVARGVHHAHENQILHRDLKPGNILLNSAGEPLVCDFGLARLGDAESSLTLSGELLGTPAYLSPEQATGKMRDLTPASDTYSLGAILYELLCGHPPFSAENIPALLRKVAEDDPLRPISHFSGSRVPFDLSTICLKCLEKDPPARYPTALALAEDLERWLRGEPIFARPVARAERVWKWVRRKPVLAALWFTITALTIVVAVVASVMSLRLDRERKAVAALAESSRHQVARQLSESAQRYIGAGDYLRALPGLAESIRIGTGDARLDEADRIRFGVLLRTSPTLRQVWLRGLEITRAESTSDGERLLIVTPKTAEVWNTSAGQRVGEPLTSDHVISNVQFDATGASVLIEANRHLLIWEPATGRKRDAGEGQISAPDAYLQKGGNFVAFTGKTAQARRMATGEPLGPPLTHGAHIEWAFMLPNSDRVLSTDANGTVYLWEVPAGTLVAEPLKLGKGERALVFGAYDPMQQRVVLQRDRDCWSINCRAGTLAGELLDAEDSPQTFGYDDHGNWYFLARNNEGVTLRYLLDGTIRWSWSHFGLGFRGSFAPAAGTVSTQSWNGSTRVWRMSNGRASSPFLWQTATPGSCILDPHGRWLLTRGDEPAARLWRLRDDDGATALPDYADNPVNAWFASGPERVCVAEENGTIAAWEKGPPHRRLGGVTHPERPLIKAEPSASGRRFFTTGARTVQVWNMEGWKPAGPRQTIPEGFMDVTIDGDGTRLAILLSDGRVSVREVETGIEKRIFATDALSLSFSADGRRLLAIGANGSRVWDPLTGQPISPEVPHSVGQTNAKFSPDGRLVLQWGGKESSGQAHATIWDAATGVTKRKLAAHWQGIGGAAWSPDGRFVATGGADQTLLLSNVETGEVVVPPIKHAQKVAAVGFSKDGLLMWSLAEKEITVWSTVSGEPVTPRLRQQRVPVAVTMDGERGRDLAVVGFRSTPRIWHLAPELRPAAELQNIARALSAHALVEGTSALRPLMLAELRASWEAARQALGAW